MPPRALNAASIFIHRGSSDGHQVVEDRVGDVLVKNALVAEALQVELQALQLDALLVGRVRDRERAEVGLAGLRAHRRELRRDDLDLVIAVGKLVFERFQQVAKVRHRAAPYRRVVHCGMIGSAAKGADRDCGFWIRSDLRIDFCPNPQSAIRNRE